MIDGWTHLFKPPYPPTHLPTYLPTYLQTLLVLSALQLLLQVLLFHGQVGQALATLLASVFTYLLPPPYEAVALMIAVMMIAAREIARHAR